MYICIYMSCDVDSLFTVDEGVIKIVYGESTQDPIGELNSSRLHRNASTVALLSVQDGAIQALICLDRNEEPQELSPALSEGA